MKISEINRNASHEEIKDKKQIRYEQILDRLDKPKTAKELAFELYEMGIIPTAERNYTAPRLTELEKMNKVVQIGKKKCDFTGKTVTVYDKSDELKMIESNMNHIPNLY